MKLEIQYPIEIEEWRHCDSERFLGHNSPNLYYSLGLTNPDVFNRCFYFNVWVNNIYNNSLNGVAFSARTYSCFKIYYERNAPTVNDLFNLIDSATFEYAKTFHAKTRNTNLSHHKIPKPNIE